MHNSSLLRMQWFVENYLPQTDEGKKLRVLDVGSYDVNGSYKHLFPSDRFEYLGLDMAEGPNVDLFMENPYAWDSIETDSFDVVISGQAFEHIEFFWVTMSEMARVLKKGGLVCIIAPNGFNEHRYPVDCYRFFTDGMVSMARYVSLEPLHAHTNLAPSKKDKKWFSQSRADSVLIAKKNYSGNTKHIDLTNYKCIPPNHEKLNHPLVSNSSWLRNSIIAKAARKIKGMIS